MSTLQPDSQIAGQAVFVLVFRLPKKGAALHGLLYGTAYTLRLPLGSKETAHQFAAFLHHDTEFNIRFWV